MKKLLEKITGITQNWIILCSLPSEQKTKVGQNCSCVKNAGFSPGQANGLISEEDLKKLASSQAFHRRASFLVV